MAFIKLKPMLGTVEMVVWFIDGENWVNYFFP
jgi:hypothetical protein